MAQDFLLPSATVPELKGARRVANESLAGKGMPHGLEVGYGSFTINGRMLGHGDPIRVNNKESASFPCFEWERNGDLQLQIAPHRPDHQICGEPCVGFRFPTTS
jgi:hypothetical protein